MSGYQHILVGIDFTPEEELVVARATEMARHFKARLSLIHVVEYLHVDLANELVLPQDLELETQIVDTARNKLAQLAARLEEFGEVTQWVELGSTKQEILRVAEEEKVDLIVVGSHGRHGIGRLLGSTANGVLHGAPCDVLAVRVRED